MRHQPQNISQWARSLMHYSTAETRTTLSGLYKVCGYLLGTCANLRGEEAHKLAYSHIAHTRALSGWKVTYVTERLYTENPA